MSRENKRIIGDNGEELWVSRSIVVIAVPIKIDQDNRVYTLVEKRGEGVSSTGKWCVPCGYLDYDENITDAVIREIREETGYIVKNDAVHLVDIYSEPTGKKQNVSFRHFVWIDELTERDNGFKLDLNEVTKLKWVEIGHVTPGVFHISQRKIDEACDWAFDHKTLVPATIERYCNDISRCYSFMLYHDEGKF